MAKTLIYPSAMNYLSDLGDTLSKLAALDIKADKSVAAKVSELATSLLAIVGKLESAADKHDFDSIEAHLNHCSHTVRPLMDETRVIVDELEGLVADKDWPLPTYEEMLFLR
jgi:glutamine synthetase